MFKDFLVAIQSIARSLEIIVIEFQELRIEQKESMNRAINASNAMTPDKIMEMSEALSRKLIPGWGVNKNEN